MRPRTGDWQSAFLATLGITANVAGACRAAGVSRQAAYAARTRHPGFRAAWDEALADAVDTLEAVAWERARSSSDTLLIFLLKAHRRDLYGDGARRDVAGLLTQYADRCGLSEQDRPLAEIPAARAERLAWPIGHPNRGGA